MKQRSIGLDIVKSLLLSIVPTFLVAALLLAVTPHAFGAHEGESSIYSGTREVRLTANALFDGRLVSVFSDIRPSLKSPRLPDGFAVRTSVRNIHRVSALMASDHCGYRGTPVPEQSDDLSVTH